MPELPEVEVLVRHLARLLPGRRIRTVTVRREKAIRPDSLRAFRRRVEGARFLRLRRRAKYLVFEMESSSGDTRFQLVGHLGMTGRLYLLPEDRANPKHAAVVLTLDRQRLVFEDARAFGRLSLDARALQRLGPEPLGATFTRARLAGALRRSRQPVKVLLLDQTLAAGVGNLYASEILFRARISPERAGNRLSPGEIGRLHRAIRSVLAEAIAWGSTVPLNWSGQGGSDRLFYYGLGPGGSAEQAERLNVYDRAGQPCVRCHTPIQRIAQAGRSTYFCPQCQPR